MRRRRRLVGGIAGLAAAGLWPGLAAAQDPSWLVGTWQAVGREPPEAPYPYYFIIQRDGRYHRLGWLEDGRGGVEESGRFELAGDVIRFAVEQWRETPDRGRPAPTETAYHIRFDGPRRLRLFLRDCRMHNPWTCMTELRRAD